MADRVLVIGLDSASLPWVERWIEAGELPNLARLMESGASGVLRSVNPPLSPAAWSSFATGMMPGKHGIFDHIYRRPDSYDVAPTNATLRAGQTLWQILSQAGRTVGVINVPETYPPSPVNGFLLSGMDTPSDDAEFSHPRGLKQELAREVGGYQVFGRRSKENLDISLAGMQETIPMRIRTARYLWESRRPDFMVLVFMETDVVQHKCWMYMDPDHPEYDSPKARANRGKYGQAILEVYRTVDRELGPWLDSLEESTAVIVMSDHGAGPLRKFLYLNNWLLQHGFMHVKKSALSRLKYLAHRAGWCPENAFKLASRLGLGIADRVTDSIKENMTNQGRTTFIQRAFLSWSDVDWSRTTAYTLGGNFTGVYVNLRGREPAGTVEPGDEYEAVRQALAERLMTWTDPESGNPVVEKVYRREELHEGPMVERAPDVIFETVEESYVGSGGHEFASNRLMGRSPLFNGHHRRDGMVVLNGPEVRPGRLATHRIVDLAPTILYLLDEPVPQGMDGVVLADALHPGALQRRPIRWSTGQASEQHLPESGYSESDEREVLNRLSDLGYL